MSEQAAPDSSAKGPQFGIQKVYVKDLSFETPNSPQIFTEKWQPDVNVDLNTTGRLLSDNVYEVVLAITVTVKCAAKTAYLAEVQQAGIFVVDGFPETERAAMLGSYCPNVLFPFARETVSDLVARGGFPQLLLAPVNFDALYAQHLQRLQNATAETDAVH